MVNSHLKNKELKIKRAIIFIALFLFSFVAIASTDTREINCLAKNIYFEARGETPTGMAAVGQVTRNRVTLGGYPDSYCKVVYQNKQFSWTAKHSKVDYSEESWKQAKFIAAYTYYIGWPPTLVGEATHFHSGPSKNIWWAKNKTFKRVTSIGGHKFYKKRSGDS